MKVLHIIRELKDNWPLELAKMQQGKGNEVAVLLLHDAVLSRPPKGFKVFASRDDVRARGVESEAAQVDYEAIVELIFTNDSVSCW
ncbi:MAG: hypothetical protein M1343_07350 [Chloroflexi bacterium]|nr:hypothetical protein [Chloroflexota bacterium]MDA8187454.1 hypothetical protein [Dehalococcoidales bacterium]